jgi:hypothetical protein
MAAELKNHISEQGNISPEEKTLQKIFEAEKPIKQLQDEIKSRKRPFKFYAPLAELRSKYAQGGEARKEVLLKLTWQYIPKLGVIAGYQGMGVEDDDLLQGALFSLQETITAVMIDGEDHTPGNVAKFAGKCIRNSTEQTIMRVSHLTLIEFEKMKWDNIFKSVQSPIIDDVEAGNYAFGARPAERIYPPKPKKHWEGENLRGYMAQTLRSGKSLIELENYPETIELPDDWQAWVNYVRKNSSKRTWGVAMIGPDNKGKWPTTYTEKNKPIDDFQANLIIGSLANAAKSQGIAKGGIEIHGHHTWWSPNGNWEELEVKKGRRPAFTPADWYRFLINQDCQMMILADTLSVLMAVKSRQTVELNEAREKINQPVFEKYWLDRHNLMIHTGFQRWLFGGMMGGSQDLHDNSDLRNMGLEIANNHKIAFYSGPQNGTLIRCAP